MDNFKNFSEIAFTKFLDDFEVLGLQQLFALSKVLGVAETTRDLVVGPRFLLALDRAVEDLLTVTAPFHTVRFMARIT